MKRLPWEYVRFPLIVAILVVSFFFNLVYVMILTGTLAVLEVFDISARATERKFFRTKSDDKDEKKAR